MTQVEITAEKAAEQADPLAALNENQRAAATFGVRPGDAAPAGPLLVIAGRVRARPARWRTVSRIC